MARQFEKPEQARKPASGFLHSGVPCPLDPKEINRGALLLKTEDYLKMENSPLKKFVEVPA